MDFPDFTGSAPRCGVSLASAGPMKPARDACNRARYFSSLGLDAASVVSVSQIHSRDVLVAESSAGFEAFPAGDGIITRNSSLVPCVTVADCMPIFLFDPETRCFGALHSGWKGTGIVRVALDLARDIWGARPEDFRVVFGPHIHSCCYTVDAERFEYFSKNFTPACVAPDAARLAQNSPWPYRLSLAEANRAACLESGVLPERIVDSGACTCCLPAYGSSRREGGDSFTHMAAFVFWH